MTGRIYSLDESANLVALDESPYDSEQLLQKLLADYPDLLAGEQVDADDPRRWLLVTREMGVPDEDDGSDRWSLDHLFLDQDAIPTLIEVKRSSDPRTRRNVIGQMLDYAANAVFYWPVERIRMIFEQSCERVGSESEKVLASFLDDERDSGIFWQQVKTNLQAGRIRLIFISDRIPKELRRIVEFLNEQMDPAKVLAIEIKQYVGSGMQTLVPRVIGQTETARRRKQSTISREKKWDEYSFFHQLRANCGEVACTTAEKCLAWARSRGLRIWWGNGKQDGSFFPIHDNDAGKQFFFSVWTYGRIEIPFQYMMKQGPYAELAKRQELAKDLTAIRGIQIPGDGIARRPTIEIELLAEPERLTQFLEVFDGVLSNAKDASPKLS